MKRRISTPVGIIILLLVAIVAVVILLRATRPRQPVYRRPGGPQAPGAVTPETRERPAREGARRGGRRAEQGRAMPTTEPGGTSAQPPGGE